MGIWIGLYEGKYVFIDDVIFDMDMLYMWEVWLLMLFIFLCIECLYVVIVLGVFFFRIVGFWFLFVNEIVVLCKYIFRIWVKKFVRLSNEIGFLLFLYCRYMRIINLCIVWMEVIRIV